MLNKTQLDFRREPKEWGNALYNQLGQLIDEVNTNIIPKMNELEEAMKKVQNMINKLNADKL